MLMLLKRTKTRTNLVDEKSL